MANGTLSTKFELLSGLADNNAKEITASDVQNIVKSNYQPVMIWSGIFVRLNTNPWIPRTLYYNPDFFKPRATGINIEDSDQIWRFTSRGSLEANTTYENVKVVPDDYPGTDTEYAITYPTQSATFNIRTDGGGAVESYDIVSCGQGWFGVGGLKNTANNWDNPGQTGRLSITGFSTSNSPTVEFIGPLTPTVTTYNNSQSPAWDLSTNTNLPTASIPGQGDNADHTFLNTQVLFSVSLGKSQNTSNPGWWIVPINDDNYSSVYSTNQLASQNIESEGQDSPNSVSLWRMPF